MTLTEARAEHPDAWLAIQQRMAELERMTDAAFIPISAEVVTDRGERVLRLMCHTDLVPSGSDHHSAVMALQSPLDGVSADASVH